MNLTKKDILLDKLNNMTKLKLLFISPDYGDTYPYSTVVTCHFDKEKFECDVLLITSDDIDKVICMAQNYDCVVNLCDGYLNNINKIPGVDIIDALEKNNIPHTGSNKSTYCLSKSDLIGMIPTPKSIHYKNYIKDKELLKNLVFPLFVKPDNLGCSELVDEHSVVCNVDELDEQLNKIINKTDNIIIQEFIDGNEYTALLFKNKNGVVICLEPAQILFTKTLHYLTHNTKVNDFNNIIYMFDIDEKTKNNIKQICIDAYEKLNINSYVRIDLRENYIIDVNSYPEILVDGENIGDSIILKSYNFNDFLIDILYDACR